MSTSSGEAPVRALPEAFGLSFEIPWSRLIKLGGAAMVLAIGAYAALSDQLAIATNNAVVSAYSVALRTPIQGVVGGPLLRIGDRVKRGANLAEVSNNLLDDQHLVDLRGHLTLARAQLAAISAEQDALSQIRGDLEKRSQAYNAATLARLTGSITEAENTLAALNARRDEAEHALSRRSSLAQEGYTSTADLDKAQADFDAASHAALAQQGQLDALQAQLTAIKNGVVTEPGSNDVAYSRQRADEIAVRLQELAQQRLFIIGDIDETASRLQSEEVRVRKLSAATMTTPISGIVWKVNASVGERIGAGETVAQIVDCDAAFVIAEVPQNRVPDIGIGSDAEFLLSGDNVKRLGRVISVTGDATGGDRNLAAVPFEERSPTATVRIQLSQSDSQCFVGRTARVILPSKGPGLISRLFNYSF